MAESICDSFRGMARRLLELGLGYLTLDRAASTLSTGERQRMQLARAVRNRTTGVLYVLDEPSIGLHPVEHRQGLTRRDARPRSPTATPSCWSITIRRSSRTQTGSSKWAPAPARSGGHVIAAGHGRAGRRQPALPDRRLSLRARGRRRPCAEGRRGDDLFDLGAIDMTTGPIHTVQPLAVRLPKGRLTVVTGVSGSGKTTLILESLIPGLQAALRGEPLPEHVQVGPRARHCARSS